MHSLRYTGRAAALATLLLLPSGTLAAQRAEARAPSHRDSIVAVHQRWWRAFAAGDTARLRALSAPELVVTLSTSERFGRDSAMRLSSAFVDSSRVTLVWDDEAVTSMGAAAVVTGRLNERIGATPSTFHGTTVVADRSGRWQVVAAHTTRVNAPLRSIALPSATLGQFAGRYRVPAGVMTVIVRDSMLVLRAPNGSENALAPVAENVFELRDSRARLDNVRFVFDRDSTGRVRRLSRLAPTGVTSWDRAP